MNINTTILTADHPKTVILGLKNKKGLPFHEILSVDSMSDELNRINFRDRFFTPDITLWAFLSQVLNEDQSQQAAVARVIAFCISERKEIPSANTAAYSKARSRLPEEFISNLARKSGNELEEAAPSEWHWKNKSVKLMDGSSLSMPDTAENQELYPQPRTQKKGAGFPLARIVTVTSHSTGAILDFAIGPWSGKGSGEHGLLRKIMHVFKKGDVALGDCYYASFFLLGMLMKRGVDVVFPIHQARIKDFRRGMLTTAQNRVNMANNFAFKKSIYASTFC
jgi:hypothetical protein